MRDDDYRDRYEPMRARLAAQFQALKLLQQEIRQRPECGIREQTLIDKLDRAIHYLQQAMDGLEAD